MGPGVTKLLIQEEHGLFDPRHRDLGMEIEVVMKARGAALGRPDDEEVGHLSV
jgi:hypothetical protein